MDTIREKPATVLVIIGILLCCGLTSILLKRSINSAVNYIPPAPLSEIILQLEDLTPGLFEQTGQKTDCNKYLLSESLKGNLNQDPIECYQVKFMSLDDSIILLNAIWVFDNLGKAEFALKNFAELIPSANNIEPSIVSVPGSLGDKSAASTAIVTGGRSPIFVTTLYWKRETTVVRLSAVSYQGMILLDEIMRLAQRIAARLDIR